MPAKSIAQQRLMGMVLQYQKGELKLSDLPNDDIRQKVKNMAKSMKKKDVEDFAKTKHKKIPYKVKKEAKQIKEQKKNLINKQHLQGYGVKMFKPGIKFKMGKETFELIKKSKIGKDKWVIKQINESQLKNGSWAMKKNTLKELFFSKKEIESMNNKQVITEGIFEEDSPKYTLKEQESMLDSIKQFNNISKFIYRDGNLVEIAKRLGKIVEFAEKYTIEQAGEWFDTITIKRNMNDLKRTVQEFYKIAKEAQGTQDRLTTLFEDVGNILNRYYEIDDVIQEDDDIVNETKLLINVGNRVKLNMDEIRKFNPTPKYLRSVSDEIHRGSGSVKVQEISKNTAKVSGGDYALYEIEVPKNALVKIQSGEIFKEAAKFDEKKMKKFIKSDKFLSAQLKTRKGGEGQILKDLFKDFVYGDKEQEDKYQKIRG